jgi:hypothetical protein
MTEAIMDNKFDQGLFTPEELALMGESEGVATSPSPLASEKDVLQAQIKSLAAMVADGCERERELRAALNALTLTSDADVAVSLQEQTHSLAKLVMASCERERTLQSNLRHIRQILQDRVTRVG